MTDILFIVLQAIWLLPIILLSYVGMGSTYHALYMRFIYTEPPDTRDAEIDFLSARISDQTKMILQLREEREKLLETVLSTLRT